jgi:hypothetical protein
MNEPTFGTKMWYFTISILPKQVLFYSFMYILSYATTGRYADRDKKTLTAIEALNRWARDEFTDYDI